MLRKGQTLWWVDYESKTEGTVVVADIENQGFSVLYNGKKYYRPYQVIGKKLFFSSQLENMRLFPEEKERPKGDTAEEKLPKKELRQGESGTEEQEPSCRDCFRRISGECSAFSNALCEDYRPKQSVDETEKANWPDHGDATGFRMKRRKPIKLEKY